MIGIYKEEFIQYLKDNLGYVKVSSKNIITRCPWCEYGKEKKHYHLYISLELPIFHCWQARCEESGFLSKLMSHIDGKDRTDHFVDKSLIKESAHKKLDVNPLKEKKALKVPEINTDQFKMKSMYMKYRLGFDVDVKTMNKLVFNVEEFVSMNDIKLDDKNQKLMDFLQSNFVGFLTEHDSLLILRNIDPNSSFRYYKLDLSESDFLDYYKIQGSNFNSNTVIISEGIFDIFAEQYTNSLKNRDSIKLYAATLSGSFSSLLKSIVFHEQLYRLNVIVLSHRDVDLDVYRKIKKFDNHIVDTLSIYYNSSGKDFATFPVNPVKGVI
jgi:hypothetical protein